MDVAAPLISQLDPCELPDGGELDELALSEALVERHGRDALSTRRIRVQESELRGLTLGECTATELLLADARLLGCDLSNIRARRGAIRRVELTGADFRGARLKRCTIRGSSLDGVLGVESLRGLTMPWSDLLGSVAALAAALGIGVEAEAE